MHIDPTTHEHATSAKVGCQIVFDSTPKDSANKPTHPDGLPVWDFDPISIVMLSNLAIHFV